MHPTPYRSSKRKVFAAFVGVAAMGLLALIHRYRSHPAKSSTVIATLPPTTTTAQSLQLSSGTITEGTSLARTLVGQGIPQAKADLIGRTLRPLYDPRQCRPGDAYEVVRSTAGEFEELRYWPGRAEYFIVQASSGTMRAKRVIIPFHETEMGASGEIQSSLWESMVRQGVPPEIIYRLSDLFASRIDFLTEPRRGDHYQVLWLRRVSDRNIIEGDIRCAHYVGNETGDVYAFRFGNEYVDADGRSLRAQFLRAPLSYRRISDYFTEHRYHPILRYNRPHHGVDYAAAAGTPVVSVGEGRVFAKGWDGGLGRSLRIRHANGYVSIYGHLSAWARKVSLGSTVHQGEVIGFVGSSGLSTGPHLHFGFQKDGKLINFLGLKYKDIRGGLSNQDKPRFEAQRREETRLLGEIPTKPAAATGPGSPHPSYSRSRGNGIN